MCFICDVCGQVQTAERRGFRDYVPARPRIHRLLEPCTYPPRYRVVTLADGTRERRCIDPGGRGWRIVREYRVCRDCDARGPVVGTARAIAAA